MDMRKYGSSTFIGVEDLRDGPEQETITSVADGKFNKPVATFESGDKLSLNKTNVKSLIKAYGPNGQDWNGCVVELHPGTTKITPRRDAVELGDAINLPPKPT